MIFKYFSVIVSIVISLIQEAVISCLDLSSFLTTASPALLTRAMVLQKFHCAATAENLHKFLLFSEWHMSCLMLSCPCGLFLVPLETSRFPQPQIIPLY